MYNHPFPLIFFSVINIILLLISFAHSAEIWILLCYVQHTARINYYNIIVDATPSLKHNSKSQDSGPNISYSYEVFSSGLSKAVTSQFLLYTQ